jgi:hypothetical protein
MANFPQNPYVGQIHERWEWDGDRWVCVERQHGPAIGEIRYDVANGRVLFWDGYDWDRLEVGGSIRISRREFATAGSHFYDPDSGIVYAWVRQQGGSGGGGGYSGAGGNGGNTHFGGIVANGGTGGNARTSLQGNGGLGGSGGGNTSPAVIIARISGYRGQGGTPGDTGGPEGIGGIGGSGPLGGGGKGHGTTAGDGAGGGGSGEYVESLWSEEHLEGGVSVTVGAAGSLGSGTNSSFGPGTAGDVGRVVILEFRR